MFKAAVIWSYVLTTGVMAITGVLTFVLAAILDPESFGVLALGMLWVGFSQMLLHHGLTMAVMQIEELTDDMVNAAFWVTLAGATVFCGISAALAPAWGVFNQLPGLAPVCWALIGVTMVTATSVIPDAKLRREMNLKGIAVRGLIGAIFGGAAGVTGALLGWGVWALVAQQLVTHGIGALTVWTVSKWRPTRPRWRKIMADAAALKGQSLQTLGGAFGVFLANRMDVLLMGTFFGPVMVGLYRFALRLAEMVVDVTSRGLQTISLPELARHQADRPQLARRLADMVHVAVVLTVPALAVLSAVAEPMVLTIGPQWSEAARPLQLLCAVSALGTVTSLLGPAMQAVQRAGIPAALVWMSAVLSGAGLGGAAWLSRAEGTINQLTAVATAALVVAAIQLVVTAILAYGVVLKISVKPTLRAIVPALFASLVGFAAAWYLRSALDDWKPLPLLLIGGSVGAVAAVGTLWATDGLIRERVSALRPRRIVQPSPSQ